MTSTQTKRPLLNHERPSFTMIEMLVTIVIIGILATISVASLSNQQQRVRNVQRIADLKKLQNALERYYAANGKYPYPPLPDCRSNPGSPNMYSCEEGGIDHGPQGGDHPNTFTDSSPSTNCQVTYDRSWAALYNNYLKPYIDAMPHDPLETPTTGRWMYGLIVGGPDDNHQHYVLTANLEDGGASKIVKTPSLLFSSNTDWSIRDNGRYYTTSPAGATGPYAHTVANFQSKWNTLGTVTATTCSSDVLGDSPANNFDIMCGQLDQTNYWCNSGNDCHFNVACVGNIGGKGLWSGRDLLERRAAGTWNTP